VRFVRVTVFVKLPTVDEPGDNTGFPESDAGSRSKTFPLPVEPATTEVGVLHTQYDALPHEDVDSVIACLQPVSAVRVNSNRDINREKLTPSYFSGSGGVPERVSFDLVNEGHC